MKESVKYFDLTFTPMNRYVFILVLICSRAQICRAQVPDSLINSAHVYTKVDSVLEYANRFIGHRYGNRANDTTSFDCSGYVKHVYGKFGVNLPHGSAAQALQCTKVDLKDVRPGDLLFFSGRKISGQDIGHVALIIRVNEEEIAMIHSTVQAGVISEIMQQSDYFMRRFIMAGRIRGFYGDIPLN